LPPSHKYVSWIIKNRQDGCDRLIAAFYGDVETWLYLNLISTTEPRIPIHIRPLVTA